MAWKRINVRLPADLDQAARAEAARLGIRQSEFIRQAIAVHVAWHRAIDAAEDTTGVDLTQLRDPDTIARLLGDR